MERQFNAAITVLLRDNGYRVFHDGKLYGYASIPIAFVPEQRYPYRFRSILSLAEHLIPIIGDEYHAGYRRIYNRYANN